MSYPSSRTDRYLKVAAEFSDLAKSASSDFSRTYYQRTAERYQALASGQTSLPQDDAVPTQPDCSPPAETPRQPGAGNGRGAAHIVRELARRFGRLTSRSAR
jgi:hypothetical protein